MNTALDVAEYFLSRAGQDDDSNDMTNMKLLKLCAYAQALSLALLGRPIFDEELEAWKHGPVPPSVYDRFSEHGCAPINCSGLDEQDMRRRFDDELKHVLELTWSVYGGFSAGRLRDMSHADFPGGFGSRRVIGKDAIRSAFKDDPLVTRLANLDISHADMSEFKGMPAEELLHALDA